ncbi:MAG: hypothetical protein LiPW15_700 [Parcubacteria group bacterium LiPW_15]|nr:MAG: hypothetical protein LiPW15_700 [Parcubacteria group bacterium LiPW_15]
MATTKTTIARWLNQAKKDGATHLIVVCDTFDHEDYPVSVLPGKDVRKVYAEYDGKNMQRVMGGVLHVLGPGCPAQRIQGTPFRLTTEAWRLNPEPLFFCLKNKPNGLNYLRKLRLAR